MLAVPVLAGSAAYAIAEAKNWRGSLEDRPGMSRKFYGVIAISMILGLVRWLQCGEDAVLFSGAERNTGAALDCSSRSVDEQRSGNGSAGKFTSAALFRVGGGSHNDVGNSRNVRNDLLAMS
jgi:hypothetical protein